MTTSILLPRARSVKEDKLHFIDFGGQLKPFMGGPVQTILRLGSRFAVEVTIPLMRTEPDGRTWGSRLVQAKIFGAMMYFRQDGLAIGTPGAPVVSGAGRTGFTLPLRGFSPAYQVREGQAFSIVTGGRRYLYFAAAATTADSAGTMTLPIYPMLRVSPADGDVCEFADPIIEGNLSGNEVAWTRMTAPFCDFGTITITENE